MKRKSKKFRLYDGHHPATLVSVQECEGEYGPWLLWTFRVTYRGHDNYVTRNTGIHFRSGSTGGRFLSGLLKRPCTSNDVELIPTLVGREYQVYVSYRGRYAYVESATPITNAV